MGQQAPQRTTISRRKHRDDRGSDHRLGLSLMMLVRSSFRHDLGQRLVVVGLVVRDLVRDLLSTLVMLELVLLPLLSALMVLPLMCPQLFLKFMGVLVVLPLMRREFFLEFMSVLVVLPLLERRFLLAQSLARDPAENGTEWAANRSTDHWSSDSGYGS